MELCAGEAEGTAEVAFAGGEDELLEDWQQEAGDEVG